MKALRMCSASAQTTETIAAGLAECCRGIPLLIYLSGELGAGKTTFCRGFLHGLGHQGNVKSPTYTVVEPYDITGMPIYHFDLYRINSFDELEAIGIREYFNGQALCLVEWPERAEGGLPKADMEFELHYNGEARKLLCKAGTEAGEKVLACLSRQFQ